MARVRPMTFAALVALVGCSSPFTEFEEGDLIVLEASFTSKGPRGVKTRIPVADGETAMLISAHATGTDEVNTYQLTTPSKDLVFEANVEIDSTESKTNAGYIGAMSNLNWPVLISDGALEAGDWPIQWLVVDSKTEYVKAPLDVTVLLKQDSDFSQGELAVNVVLAGQTSTDSVVREAVEDAVGVWTDAYAAVGIELVVSYVDFPTDVGLEAPGFGSDGDLYEQIASETALRSVNLVVAEEISSFSDILGISGDIPGPLIASGNSAVLVSTDLAAGPDGLFSREEVRIMGETMAHEVGHYLGLFHPVEASYDLWDALADTDTCGNEQDCVDALGTNMMFPYPVCGLTSCFRQSEITDEQAGVMHRHVGVN